MLRGNRPHGSSPWAKGPRSRHCRQRLDALPCQRHHQPQAIIVHRFLSVGMAKYLTKGLDVGRKSRFTPSPPVPSIPVPQPVKNWAYIPYLVPPTYNNTA
jgi:hypothetical protein